MKNPDEVSYEKATERYPIGSHEEPTWEDYARIGFKNGFKECARLKDEEWRKVVEPLVEAGKSLIERINYNGGLGEYNGGPAFVVSKFKKALEDYEKKVGEK